jgi:hypothetical protein
LSTIVLLFRSESRSTADADYGGNVGETATGEGGGSIQHERPFARGGPAGASARASIGRTPSSTTLPISADRIQLKAILLPASNIPYVVDVMSIDYGGSGASLTYELRFFEFTLLMRRPVLRQCTYHSRLCEQVQIAPCAPNPRGAIVRVLDSPVARSACASVTAYRPAASAPI